MARIAYALDDLVSEVLELKDSTEVSYGEPDGIDVVREVTFTDGPKDLSTALGASLDDRVARIEEDGRTVKVVVQTPSPLADRRGTYSLKAALDVLAANEQSAPDADEVPSEKSDGGAQKRRRAAAS